MSGRKPFHTLRAPIEADPARRARTEQYRRAMRDALALSELREARGMTQSEVATAMHVTQRNVSRVEHENDVYLSTLSNYVAALGGRLRIAAEFPDTTVTLDVPSTAKQDSAATP